MESNMPLDSEIHALEITPESRGYILETAKWGRFLAIVGLAFMGLFLLLTLFMGGTLFSSMSDLPDDFGGGPGAGALGGIYIAYMIFVYAMILVPLYYLYSFSSKTINAINTSSTGELTEGFKNLKSLFKFYGIFMAVILGIYALIFVGGLLVGFG